MNRRVIDVYWDVVNRKLYDSTGAGLASTLYPYISFREKPLIRLRLVISKALAVYTGFDGTETFRAAVDYDFNQTVEPMCRTPAGEINVAADWASIDVTQGKFSIRLDADTTTFQTAVGTSAEKAETKLELLAFNISGDVVFATRFPLRCFNLMDSGAGDPPSAPGNYYTKAETEAQFIAKRADSQGIRLEDDGFMSWYFPDGHWYKKVPMIVDGKPSEDWVLVE